MNRSSFARLGLVHETDYHCSIVQYMLQGLQIQLLPVYAGRKRSLLLYLYKILAVMRLY